MNAATPLLALAATAVVAAPAASAQSILFVRGADRSGGFLEANNDAGRTEQLADIDNASTAGGNHGWATLAGTLRGAGFAVEQIVEPLEANAPATGQTAGAPIAFESMDLSRYDAIVFGSNNAAYGPAQADAVEAYVRAGGGAIFISDANFGSDWADASDSDQAFLDRFGLIAHQDNGTYAKTRSDGEFLVPDHPIFAGVDAFDGEGVTPARVGTLPDGVTAMVLASAEEQTRLNEPPFGSRNQGPKRAAVASDAALLVAEAGRGRVVVHFDRNTFFNANGAGTDLTRLDNRRYAENLFAFAATDVPEPASGAAAVGLGAGLVRRRRRATPGRRCHAPAGDA